MPFTILFATWVPGYVHSLKQLYDIHSAIELNLTVTESSYGYYLIGLCAIKEAAKGNTFSFLGLPTTLIQVPSNIYRGVR